MDPVCPVILIPNSCTSLGWESEANKNSFLNLNISTVGTDRNLTRIYSGVCNLQLLGNNNLHIIHHNQTSHKTVEKQNEKKLREERIVKSQCQNKVLKQLISPTTSKQTSTILYYHGKTIQKMKVNDPSTECVGSGELDALLFEPKAQGKEDGEERGKTPDESSSRRYPTRSSRSKKQTESVPLPAGASDQKKYQCDRCQQLFDQLSLFKQHLVKKAQYNLFCEICKKNLKTREKFEQHLKGHGDLDVQCKICGKVYASKYSLRIHVSRLHSRE